MPHGMMGYAAQRSVPKSPDSSVAFAWSCNAVIHQYGGDISGSIVRMFPHHVCIIVMLYPCEIRCQ